MAVTINASTTSGLVMTSDLSGVLTLQQNGVSLPNGGVAPAFSAYASSNISIPNNTFTKVAFQTEEFDTNSNYDNATNYRFTPTVAGYYQVNSQIAWGVTTTTSGTIIAIYKNGTRFKDGSGIIGSNVWGNQNNVACLISMNGSTDYIEVYAYQNSGGAVNVNSGGPNNTYFQACLVRGA
jgi:hypothetical protein